MREIIRVLEYAVIPIAGSLFLGYVLADAMIRMGCSRQVAAWKRNLIFAVYTALAVGSLFWIPAGGQLAANILIIMAGYPLIAHFTCNGSRTYLIYYLGLTAACMVLDVLISWFCNRLFFWRIVFFVQEEYYALFYILISKMAMFLLARGYVWLVRRREGCEVTRKQYAASLLLPVFSLFFVYSLLYFMQIYLDELGAALFTVNICLILFLNIWYPIQEKNRERAWERDVRRQKEELEKAYYADLQRRYESSQSVLHDIRGHVQVLEQLCTAGTDERAQQYASDLHQMLSGLGEQFYTSHRVLNMILNDKAHRMRELGIVFEAHMGGVDFQGYRDVDITVIFDNILNNAIKAAASSADPFVRLRGRQIRDLISISLSNACGGKEESVVPGVGLKNVERCIADYHGDIQYQRERNLFTVQILLPVLGPEEDGSAEAAGD